MTLLAHEKSSRIEASSFRLLDFIVHRPRLIQRDSKSQPDA
jgi:hypothetical protein